jgi:hypothetical protein
MRKLIAVTQMTLDGVMQALGGPEEDSSGGLDREQRGAMLTVAVQEYIADLRPVFGERTA